MNPYKKLSISKTSAEWALIEHAISDSGKTDLTNFLRSKINVLISDYAKCPKCVTKASGKSVEKRPYIFIDQFHGLRPIAKKMKVPISEVINRLILEPLLK